MNNLLIYITSNGQFWHRHNGIVDTDFNISDFEVSIDGNVFNIIQNDGAVRFQYLVSNITIKTYLGSIESGFTPTSLKTRLTSLGYTPYLTSLGLTVDQINAINGANSPSVTNPFATIADLGGSTSFNKIIQWDGGTIAVPIGFSGTVFNLNNSLYPTYTELLGVLTITANADSGDNLLLTSN